MRRFTIHLLLLAGLAVSAISMSGPGYSQSIGPGRCVPCPECPPCGDSYSGGGGSGSGTPVLFCLFVPGLCPGFGASTSEAPPTAKPEMPRVMRDWLGVQKSIRSNLSERIIRTDPKHSATVRSSANLSDGRTGTAFFTPPGGRLDEFLPNPPEASLLVPSGPKVKVDATLEQLQYALAIVREADKQKNRDNPEAYRFLLDQAGHMLAGEPVQLYLGNLQPVPATGADLDAIEDLYDELGDVREGRVAIAREKVGVARQSERTEARIDQHDGFRFYLSDEKPSSPELRQAFKTQEELGDSYERFLIKDRELRQEYREKAEAVMKDLPTVGFHFGTKIVDQKPPNDTAR
ncbi:MAG: hypothetical protein ABJ215_07320 [Alphaproteobacteria bacterium]